MIVAFLVAHLQNNDKKSEVYTMVVYIKKRPSLLPVLIQEMQHSSYLTNHATPSLAEQFA